MAKLTKETFKFNGTEIETYLNEKQIPYKIHFTPEEHGSKIKTEELIKNGATNIVAVGGDGTLHEVINGFSNFENVTLGLVPCGTGNDFASAMGIPEDTIEALKIILKNGKNFIVQVVGFIGHTTAMMLWNFQLVAQHPTPMQKNYTRNG